MLATDQRQGTKTTGSFIDRDGQRYYRIGGVEHMAPFLLTVVSDSDLWLYASTSGGLTTGRVSPEHVLFPYVNDDLLHATGGVTGPITIIRTTGPDGEPVEWRPFDPRGAAAGSAQCIERSPLGDEVIFEESNEHLGLTFRMGWSLSGRHGIVRNASIERHADAGDPIQFEMLDGLLNVMPASVLLGLQQTTSTLVDAYKRTEFDPSTGLAIFALEASISDRAEPSESLRSNTVWRAGLPDATVALATDALREFERRGTIRSETLSTGRRGAYLCHVRRTLAPGESESWMLVGDVHQDQASVAARQTWLGSTDDLAAAVRQDLATGRRRLEQLLADADSSQCTADEDCCTYHRANVLFNCMRGGTFVDGATIDREDFLRFLAERNKPAATAHAGAMATLPERISVRELHAAAEATGDTTIMRLSMEYLPLTFGRRHGDPSRPWNRFAIRVRHADGSRILDYQGNWRDIFQNWEALCRSYPDYLFNVIAKFVNASTADGYNPYRLSRDGIDWETPDPEDPWANIGYWGDHQIIYLLRLLEQMEAGDPGRLGSWLDRQCFSYADVPYRIRPYPSIVRDSKASIDFDHVHEDRIQHRVENVGADGRLITDDDGDVVHVSLLEKLLVPALAKISNLVPGGGIWLNTQRPEWNDANNALVGNGLSMVTLFQLRRYTDFCVDLLATQDDREIVMSGRVIAWCDAILKVLVEHLELLDDAAPLGDTTRRRIVDRLGTAFSDYRDLLYEKGLGEQTGYPIRVAADFFRLARHYCDHAIACNKRDDGLFESYNVLQLTPDQDDAVVSSLAPMLEGQVAALHAGTMSAAEATTLLDTMFASPLFRPDQNTFILYPNRARPDYLDRNVVPDELANSNPLMQRLLNEGVCHIAVRDVNGTVRFSSDFTAAPDLEAALRNLANEDGWADDVNTHLNGILDIYETVFRHHEFIGRSGCMHKFEGLGSVYWHMVSKLLLAAAECAFEAADRDEPAADLNRLIASYYRVRDGLGFNKSPGDFGAFPHEPYSHTPAHAGAQQPGMTGQVKEGVLARFSELGVRCVEGRIVIQPMLLRASEFLEHPVAWHMPDGNGGTMQIDLPAQSLGFTMCRTPFVMHLGDTPGMTITRDDGACTESADTAMSREDSQAILGRTGEIVRVDITVTPSMLYSG